MKKIIAIAVVFALVVGSAFAADVSGTVHGTATLMDLSTKKSLDDKGDEVKSDLGAGGGMSRVRAEFSGGSDDEKWGGWVRFEGDGGVSGQGNAWWKPIDQLLVRFGKNADGIWGKEGNTGWMFMQTPTDTGATYGGENVWGWNLGGAVAGFGQGIKTRDVFFNGYEDNRLALEINPISVLGINLALPMDEGLAGDFYKCIVAQVNLNLAFGNIAITYKGGKGYTLEANEKDPTITNQRTADPGKLFLYFGGNFGAIAIDFGFSFAFPYTEADEVQPKDKDDVVSPGTKHMAPIGLGLGFKFYNDGVFGIKARVATTLGGKHTPKVGDAAKEPVKLLFDVLPYFVFSDNFSLFISGGFVMTGKLKDENYAGYVPDGDDNGPLGSWHVNPYVVIGSEWGPKFMAGIKVHSTADYWKNKNGDIKKYINFSIPVAIQVGF